MFKRRTLTSALIAATLLVATSAFAQFAERTIKFTNGVNEDHPVGLGVKRMQEVLNAKTGGKIKINAFWGGSAGGDLPATQALRAGTQEMVCTSSSPLVGIVKELGAFDLPFLFANEKEADAVLDGPAGAYFNKKLEEAGLVNLAYWENGFRNLTNSKRPVAKPEDFDGVKVRVMQNNTQHLLNGLVIGRKLKFKHSPNGEIGIHRRLKISHRKVWGFDSPFGHHLTEGRS